MLLFCIIRLSTSAVLPRLFVVRPDPSNVQAAVRRHHRRWSEWKLPLRGRITCRHCRYMYIYNIYTDIMTNDEIFLNDATKLFKYFLARQCSFSDVLHNFSKVKQIDRQKLLSHTPKQQHKNICLITKFSQKIDHFIKALNLITAF